MNTLKPLKKSDSVLEKINIFNRKKHTLAEIKCLEAESKHAINLRDRPTLFGDPEDFNLSEGQSVDIINPHPSNPYPLRVLKEKLINWINLVLTNDRILIKSLEEDLHDGQILQKLIEQILDIKLDFPEVTHSEFTQRQKLENILAKFDTFFGITYESRSDHWTAQGIQNKDIVQTLKLLVKLCNRVEPSAMYRKDVFVEVIRFEKNNGELSKDFLKIPVMDVLGEDRSTDPVYLDDLTVDNLIEFSNFHLQKLVVKVNNINEDFRSGVNLIRLLALLGNFYVPLYAYFDEPVSEQEKLKNVNLYFAIAEDYGISCAPVKPEEIVSGDQRQTVRLLRQIQQFFENQDEQLIDGEQSLEPEV